MYLERKLRRKKINKILIIAIPILILLLGTSFAFFTFFKSNEAFILSMNGVPMQVEFKEGTNVVNLPYAYPISDEFAIGNLNKLGYVDFTVSGGTPSNEYLYYELYLTEEDGNTLESNYIKVYLTDDTDEEIVKPSIYNSLPRTLADNQDGKVIYKETTTGIFEKTYRLYVWIDSAYTQNIEHQSFSFKVNLYAYNTDKPIELVNDIKSKLNESNSVTDEDGTTYLKGDNSSIDFNYVWYSGKLWQIYSINQDDTMKLITYHGITSIRYGPQDNVSFKESWVYQWLNEDFKDTLYNYEDFIVQDVKWDTAIESNSIPIKPTGSNQEVSDIGLINYYEVYKTKAGSDISSFADSYITNGFSFWTLTPKASNSMWGISTGVTTKGYTTYDNSLQVKPVIVLKDKVKINGGNGSKNNPFTLQNDKEIAKPSDKLNTRINGEYVNYAGEKYIIVGIDNKQTKLVKEDSIKDASGNEVLKLLGIKYGLGIDNTYADYYLNHEWYNSLPEDYKKMLVADTYYLGAVANDTHKVSICEVPSDNTSIKDCKKLERDVWTGKVGLIRVGEIFSTISVDNVPSNNTWTITPQNATHPKSLYKTGGAGTAQLTYTYSMRPTVTLLKDVYITSGKGTSEEPYEIAVGEVKEEEYKKEVATVKIKETIGNPGGVIGVTNQNQMVIKDEGNIREFRYSGISVNNYVTFNDETWRIVGVFKDEKGNEHLKIVRNEVLSGIFPEIYTIDDVTYGIKGDSGDTQATYSIVGKNSYGDWSNAGLMYFLNTESDKNGIPGYLSKINSTYKNMIEDTKYYLGTVSFTDKNGEHGVRDTVIQAYQNERDVKSCVNNIGTSDFASGCHVWANNHATWTGKIGLLYPSDYGFTMESENWTTLFAGKDSSWLKNANHSKQEWFISKVSSYNWYIAMFDGSGNIEHNWSHNTEGYSVRPTLYLKSDIVITAGAGSMYNPYVLDIK